MTGRIPRASDGHQKMQKPLIAQGFVEGAAERRGFWPRTGPPSVWW